MTVPVTVGTSASEAGNDAAVILFLFGGDSPTDALSRAGLNSDSLASLPEGWIADGRYETTLVPGNAGTPHLLFIGAGKRTLIDPVILLRVATAASRYLTGKGFSNLCYVEPTGVDSATFAHAAAEGAFR